MNYPRISIEYCAKCKWGNRAVWYLQELLQTFDKPGLTLNEVALQPLYDQPGVFRVTVFKSTDDIKVVYQRKMKNGLNDGKDYVYEGFPDSKFLKQLVRNYLFPEGQLGHIDTTVVSLNEGCRACEQS